MQVLKFGGSSVSTPERIRAVIEIVRPMASQGHVVLVFSAFGGVTDMLIKVSELALSGNTTFRPMLKELELRHLQAVRALIGIQQQNEILATVKSMINELEDVIHGIYLVKERTPRMLDFVMSFGERLSAYIITNALCDQGIQAGFLDARAIIRTDNQFGHAKVDFEKTNKLIREHFKYVDVLQVVTGFIATSESGETTTLGRSGSDYTAAILAGALHAESLEIWTDVNGMMTADPRRVKKAFTVKEMTYAEAMELSHFGAKVIFPSTMQPAMVNEIPIWIKNTFDPSFPGTIIGKESNGKDFIIKGISSIDRMSLLSVQGSGLRGVVGVSMRLFASLARENINVILISQASSEHSICFAIENPLAGKAKAAIEKEFMYEIRAGEMEEVSVVSELAIIAIVGERMRHNPGTSGRMFHALGKSGVNVYAIAQGASELNISAVIHESDVSKALNVLHEAFFLSDKRVINLFLLGTGLIGKELLKMVNAQYRQLAEQNLLEVNVVAVANRTRMMFGEDGLDASSCVERMKAEGEVMSLDGFVQRMKTMNLSNSTFIDCTASEEVTEQYETILHSNISIVTPNKKANSGPLERYHRLKRTSMKRGVRFLYETNVGAGLPVINTLNDLLLSGDKIIRIEAVLSGTLNFIFSSFTTGIRFTDIVKKAKELGYTEPDPREDLNGMDVARKVLILSREAGIDLELSDIEVLSLVPDDCLSAPTVEAFLTKLSNHDAAFERDRAEAETRKEKLRYTAVIENGKASVSLMRVDADHPFYSLKGSDNIILLTTERYRDRPMVIRGPGAGAAVTAAGVFADVIRIGNYSIR